MAYGNRYIDDEIAAIDERARGPAPPPITLTGEARRQIAEAIKLSIAAHAAAAKTKVRFEQRRHNDAAAVLERAGRLLDKTTAGAPAVSEHLAQSLSGQIDALADRAVIRIAADFADKTSSLTWRDGVIDLADGAHRTLLHRSIADALLDVKRPPAEGVQA